MDSFSKLIDMIMKLIVYITRRMTYVDSPSKITGKEDIHNIKKMNKSVARDGDTENNTNGGRFDNRTECVIKIKIRLLRESLRNKPTFVSINMMLTIFVLGGFGTMYQVLLEERTDILESIDACE